MPINHEGEVLYSTEELSRILSVEDLSRSINVAEDEVTKFILEKDFNRRNLNGAWCLKKEVLGDFFDQFSISLGVSYKHHEIPEYLKNCTSPWAVTLVRMYQEKFTWSAALQPAQGELMRNLVLNTDPKTVLEIGCFVGVSSIWMASGLEQLGKEGIVHSVDLFNDIMPGPHVLYRYLRNPLEYAQKAATSAQLSHRIKFHKADSKEMGQKVDEIIGEPIDLLFIDGDHSIEGCLNDFILFYPHVSVGGYIVLHDIYPQYCGCDGPRYVIDNFIKGSPYFELVEIKTTPGSYGHGNYGMSIIRKLGPQQDWTKRQRRAMSARAARNVGMALMSRIGRELGRDQKTMTSIKRSKDLMALIHRLSKEQKP